MKSSINCELGHRKENALTAAAALAMTRDDA